jgi:hypothetical protein
MFVNDPMWLTTFRNWSGRSHAAVNAQMPPLLIPQIARCSGSSLSLYCLPTSGRISSSRNRAYWSLSVSYSKLRFVGLRFHPSRRFPSAGGGFFCGSFPGLMKIPIVTGISPRWIRLSNTTGVRNSPFSFTYACPS